MRHRLTSLVLGVLLAGAIAVAAQAADADVQERELHPGARGRFPPQPRVRRPDQPGLGDLKGVSIGGVWVH